MIRDLLNEGKAEKGMGSKAGREKYTSKKGIEADTVKARKSRARIFPTIMDALKSSAGFGTVFSTTGSDRLYVITKRNWGTDKDQVVGNRVAKGFTPGSATPSARYTSIKAHAKRIAAKHKGGKKETNGNNSKKSVKEMSFLDKCLAILESDSIQSDSKAEKDARAAARVKARDLTQQVHAKSRKNRELNINKRDAARKAEKKKAAFQKKLGGIKKTISRFSSGVLGAGETKRISDS